MDTTSRRVGGACVHPLVANGLPSTDDRGLVVCPLCQETNLHLGAVVVDQLGAEVIVTARGVKSRTHRCDRRGSLVRVRLLCEHGHGAWLQLAHHKGVLYAGFEPFPLELGPWPAGTELRRS